MAKSRDKNEVEHLRGIIRQQKAQIRYYRKELRRFQKDDGLDDEDDDYIPEIPQEAVKTCSSCGKGFLKRELVGIRYLVKCTSCDYSKFERKNGKD